MSLERKRQMIERGHAQLSIARQCELVSISRLGFYYRAAGETPLNLELMRVIDAQFLETPCCGSVAECRGPYLHGRSRTVDGQRVH
jgi:putative transposase